MIPRGSMPGPAGGGETQPVGLGPPQLAQVQTVRPRVVDAGRLQRLREPAMIEGGAESAFFHLHPHRIAAVAAGIDRRPKHGAAGSQWAANRARNTAWALAARIPAARS